MQEVMVINPRKGKKVRKKMARKRKTRRSAPPVARRIHRRARRNPTMSAPKNRRTWRKRAASTARGLIGSLQPLQTVKLAAQNLVGMLIVQFASRKFGGDSPGGSKDNWSKRNYLFGLLGAAAGAALADLVKKGTGKHVLQGGLALIGYQLFVNEIAPQTPFLANNFGEDNLLGFSGYGADSTNYSPGDLALGDDGRQYLAGDDGYFRPVDESHRLMSGEDALLGFGEELVSPGRLGGFDGYDGFGEEMITPGRLGEVDRYAAIYGEENN